MKIVLGADSNGFDLKESVKAHLQGMDDLEIDDLSTEDDDTPYFRTATEVAQRISDGEADRGILVCGSGMGMCIIANKHPGVFAAVCENAFAAEKARSINNANVLTLGGFVTTPMRAAEIVDAFLDTDFTEGWDPEIQDWLEGSMHEIAELEDELFGLDED